MQIIELLLLNAEMSRELGYVGPAVVRDETKHLWADACPKNR